MISTLIADDEIDMRLLTRMTLEAADLEVEIVGEARDGREALELWRSLDPPRVPTIVVLDNRMPGMSGLEVAIEMLDEAPTQKVILFTAFTDDAVELQANRLGVLCMPKTDSHLLPQRIHELATR